MRMICSNDSSNEIGNQLSCSNDSNKFEPLYLRSSQKNESGCFPEYFDDDYVLSLEHLQMADTINQSNMCYWKNPHKLPKFMHEVYLLGDTIGRGSYGKVKDCVDMRTMKRYAMKIVHQMKIKKIPGGMKHVESEIKLMKTLSHENIVKLVDDFYELEPERRCLVMEFCLGSIHDLQTNGLLESSNQFRCLPEWQTRNYFIQIVDGLEYLHDRGLIHKDMKPGNFLLTQHENVKITDFGVSEQLEKFQINSLISGGQTTPAIQPPELAIGASNICGYKLDIYGTGVSLYFMLCGRVPFSNPNILLIFDEIASGQYTIPDWVSLAASDLIRNMMLKDVNKRFDMKNIKSHNWYVNPCEKNGAKVDPKIYLNYAARDPTKEDLYRLSTGIVTNDKLRTQQVKAIMPMTVVSRLRTYFNWPMTEKEEKAEIDEQLLIGEDFIGRERNAYQVEDLEFHVDPKPVKDNVIDPPQKTRFFIHSDDRNDSHGKVDSGLLDPSRDYSMSASFSQFVLSNQDGMIERDNVSSHTIPFDNDRIQSFSGKKTSSRKSKSKFGRKFSSRCTQS